MTNANIRPSMIGIISDAKRELMEKDVPGPYFIRLSPMANQALLDELEKRDGKRHSVVLEVCGMRVEIDPNCPQQGAYVTGEKP